MKNLLQMSIKTKRSFRHLTDLDREIGDLFGYPFPRLPQGDEIEEGQKRIFVDFPQNFGVLLRDFLHTVHSLTTEKSEGMRHVEQSFGPLREALVNTAVQTILQERRNGLINLFYLAFSKLFAGIVKEFFSAGGRKPYHKFLLHPELSAFLIKCHEDAISKVEDSFPGSASFRLGTDFNDSLIKSVLYDQLPLITSEVEEVQVQDVLGISNPRFTITLSSYKEIYGILVARIRKGIEKRESAWLKQIQGSAVHSGPIDPKSVPALLQHIDVVRYLLMDYAEVGKKMLGSKNLKREKLSSSELGQAYLDLMQALKRNEIIQYLKRSVEILSDRQAARAEDLYSAGSLYRFSEKGRVVNEARNITTLFLDLRGFTKKSEEAISAGELTDELYAIFDPITSIVQDLNGKVDKFTGDGMMVTFGVESKSKEDPLNALRVAVRVQKSIRSLRKKGKTNFQMGIAIHSGVSVAANFIAGDDRVDNTVIGRNVNIAGRLSSAGDLDKLRKEKKEFDDLIESLKQSLSDESEQDRFLGSLDSAKTVDKSISGVSVDAKGNLYNLGVVLSQQTIHAIDQVVQLQSGEDGNVGYRYYFDPLLSRQISLYYVGDAKFKGVESAFPIYAVLL